MIIYKSFHNINVLNGTLIKKNMPEDFDSFVNSYIVFAIRNGNNKEYNVTDPNSTVIHCISSIAAGTINCPEISEDDMMELDSFSHSIATKLLCEEQQAQMRIAAMGRLKFPVTNAIELSIEEGNSNYRDAVKAVELAGGKRCLQIECHVPETYNLFV